MRKLSMLIALGTMFVFIGCSQAGVEVPASVETAFSQKFPEATKVKWEKESETEWEAEFMMDGKEYSAAYDATGKWLETEHEIEESEIPETVSNTLASEFAGYEIDEAELCETAEGTLYEFELEMDDTEIEVQIDMAGNVIKKETEKEDEGDDDDE